MKIAFISYWGINDPLTVATVYPHLAILQRSEKVAAIFLLTFERSAYTQINLGSKVKHFPIVEKRTPRGINKLITFRNAWKVLKEVQIHNSLDLVIGRSSFAGILGYHLNKKYKVPFAVESLEPHTDYMETSGEWKSNGLKSKILRNYEKKILQKADLLLPVANNYKADLISKGVKESKIKILPCTIDESKFFFDTIKRRTIRDQLKYLEGDRVGIYVGKFGGIYYDSEAFDIFAKAFDIIPNFKLIILTPITKDIVLNQLKSKGIDLDNVAVMKVKPEAVNDYLCAADFAFAFYKQTRVSKYLSPIKIGEYWMNGLLTFLPENIGDDSAIITKEGIGEIFSIQKGNIADKLKSLNYLLASNSREEWNKQVLPIGRKYRSMTLSEKIYKELLEAYY